MDVNDGPSRRRPRELRHGLPRPRESGVGAGGRLAGGVLVGLGVKELVGVRVPGSVIWPGAITVMVTWRAACCRAWWISSAACAAYGYQKVA